MSRRRRRRALAVLAAGVALAALPASAAGHAIDTVYQLPVPLWLYLWAAAAAVGASFVVSVLVIAPPGPTPGYPTLAIAPWLARIGSAVLSVVGVVWWVGAIVAGFVFGDPAILPAVLFWSGIWVGVPMAAVLLGNPWPSLSPFRTLFSLAERAVRLAGGQRLDAGFAYPARARRWPAVALLFAAIWFELVYPGASGGRTVALLLAAYTVLTLLGMTLFGRVAWVRNAELFEILFGWFGRLGPIGRRVVVAAVCRDCGEACRAERCVDCPECAVVAEPGERRVELRPWISGLTEVSRAGWSDAVVIVLALAGVTFDGFRSTIAWGWVLTYAIKTFGPFYEVIVVFDTIGLFAIWLVFLAVFSLAARLTRALDQPSAQRPAFGEMAGAYAATLLPIAGGYLIAHYLTLVIQAAVWLPDLVRDPIAAVAPTLTWIPSAFVWYVSVGAIVGGHIAAVVIAHRLALRDAPRRAALAGLPLVILMVGYTILSLWIIAQPIVIEPGVPFEARLPIG